MSAAQRPCCDTGFYGPHGRSCVTRQENTVSGPGALPEPVAAHFPELPPLPDILRERDLLIPNGSTAPLLALIAWAGQVRDEAYAVAERDVVAYIESAAAICRSAPGNTVRRDLARQIKAGEHR